MNCGNTYYFIDDCNDICKCKNGVQKEFSEKLELLDLIDDINEIIDENEQLKQRNKKLLEENHLLKRYIGDIEGDWND